MRHLVLALFWLAAVGAQAKEWSHIEYGAANVTSGRTRANPAASKQVNDLRYQHLYDQMDALVLRNGRSSVGTFYVNDLEPEETGRAANLLYLYAQRRGYRVRVISLPGDYFQMELPITDTAALHNPEGDFFESPQIRNHLTRLGEHTREGLEFATAVRAAEAFGFESLGEGRPYIDPTGRTVPRTTQRFRVPGQSHPPSPFHPIGDTCPVITSRLAAPQNRR